MMTTKHFASDILSRKTMLCHGGYQLLKEKEKMHLGKDFSRSGFVH